MKNNKHILIAVLSVALVFILAMGSISFADNPSNYTGFNLTEHNTTPTNNTGYDIDINNSTSNSTVSIGNSTVVPGSTIDDANNIDISGIKDKTYNGKAQTQAIIVKDNSEGQKTLEKDKDYKVSYKNNINAGTASVIIEGIGEYSGSVTKTFKINKAANTLKVTPKTAKIKFKKLKKNNAKLPASKVMTVKGKKGKLSYKIVKVTKKKYRKYFKIDKAGKVTVKKKLRKGTYKIKVKVTDSGNSNYNGSTKQVTFKIKVTK